MKLIGICGHIGAGKTTLATHIAERHGYVRTSFAGAIREDIAAALAFLDGDPTRYEYHLQRMNDRLTKELYRPMAQAYGTEYRRAEDPDFWTNRMRTLIESSPAVVIDDVRFPNEAAMILALGGTLVRVTRPRHTNESGHLSEQHVDNLPASTTVLNDGDLSDLYEQADALMEDL